jgi:membrane protease YdiL (CAAX protease family)
MAQWLGDMGEGMIKNDRRQFRYTRRMLGLYFVLTFAITWAILIPALAIVPEDGQILFIVLAAFGPFLAAVITIWTSKGRAELGQWLRQVLRLRLPVVLYLAGTFFLPIGVGLLQYGLYRVLGGEPDLTEAIPWYLYLLYLLPTALLTGGNEEPGWRGLALPALLERFHPVLATLILGVIHATWHLPLMDHYDTTFGWYLFGLIPLTCIFNWLYLKSQKSVIPVALFHAGTNVIGSFLPTPMDVLGGLGTFVFLRGLVYWGITIVLLIVTKGRLGYDPTEADLV